MSTITIPLQLSVRLDPASLTIRLQNRTAQALRVWDPANSWGGASWSLHLVPVGGGAEHVLRPNKRPYTVNLPRFIEVPAHGQHELALAPGGPEWTFGEDLSAWRSISLGVRVVLDIAPSDEAARQQVATGQVESAEANSQPPHRWLFATAAADR